MQNTRATNSTSTTPLLTVVIPTYNGSPSLLREALDSLDNQTLDRNLFKTIIVDDASDRPELIELLSDLESKSTATRRSIAVIRHQRNQWLAQARITGASKCGTEFVAFLDDDDWLKPDFLKKTLLLLIATPEASWVYTDQFKFGQLQHRRKAAPFSPFRFFFRNQMSYASVFRTSDWLRSPPREILVRPGLRIFEDWDGFIRLMGRGLLGTPLNDTYFAYRIGTAGYATRSPREYVVSVYITYVRNLTAFFMLPRAMLKQWRLIRIGFGYPSSLNPVKYINYAVRLAATKLLMTREIPRHIDGRTLMMAMISPHRFAQRVLNESETINLAELKAGFSTRPKYNLPMSSKWPEASVRGNILAAHTWWGLGGAENIFLGWLKQAHTAGANKLIDVTQWSGGENDLLKAKYAEIVDEQFALQEYGETPLQRLNTLWQLICLHRPDLIFISGNALMYMLTPFVKRQFPQTQVVDILHNEFGGIVDWFTISSEYADFIDRRLVTSQYWADLLTMKYGVPEPKIIVTANAVDTEEFDPRKLDKRTQRVRLGLPRNKRIIGFVGRFHEQKNPDVFLALVEIMADDPRYHFLMAGSGEKLDEVRERQRLLKNLDVFISSTSVEKHLGAMDVLVCPSRYEGYPLIGLEAFAMNVPVIAPDIVGFTEQIGSSSCGLCYQSNGRTLDDAHTIAALLHNNFDELISSASRGRNFVLLHHSEKIVGEQYRLFLQDQLRVNSRQSAKVINVFQSKRPA